MLHRTQDMCVLNLLLLILAATGCIEPMRCRSEHSGPEVVSTHTVRFVAVGDTGSGEAGQYAVGRAIAKKCARDGCDFVLLLGDNFDHSGVDGPDDPQWESKFRAPYADVDAPFYVVLGNHDYNGTEFYRGAYQIEYAARDDTWRLPSECYSFQTPQATFLALDTQLIIWDHGGAVIEQSHFAAEVLSASRAPWRIAYGHHPFRSNGKNANAGHYGGVRWPPTKSGRYLDDVFKSSLCNRADLYLNGHRHSRQVLRGPTDCPMALIVAGAGAHTTGVAPRGNTLFADGSLGFAYFEVRDDVIVGAMVNTRAETDFKFRVRRDRTIESF